VRIDTYMNADTNLDPVETLCDVVCPHVSHPQKAVVAVSMFGGNAVVVSATCGVGLNMNEGGIDASDAWPSAEISFWGLRVWEGCILEVRHSDGDIDVEFRGTWRELRTEEATAVVSGQDPFRCPHCDGYGITETTCLTDVIAMSER